MKVRPHGERRHNERPEHLAHKPIESMRLVGRRACIRPDMGGDSLCSMEEGGNMCQSVEEVDRISWEAEMMRAEEHFDSMDEDAYEDREEETDDESWSTKTSRYRR